MVVSVQTPQRDARGLQGAPRDGPKGLCPTQAAPDRNGALERSPRHGEHPALPQIWERVLGTKPSCCSGEFPLEKPPWVFLIPSNEEPAAMAIAAAPPGDFAQAGAGKSPPSAGGHGPSSHAPGSRTKHRPSRHTTGSARVPPAAFGGSKMGRSTHKGSVAPTPPVPQLGPLVGRTKGAPKSPPVFPPVNVPARRRLPGVPSPGLGSAEQRNRNPSCAHNTKKKKKREIENKLSKAQK